MIFDDAWLGNDEGFTREHDSEGKLIAFSCQSGQTRTRVDLQQMQVTTVENCDPELTPEEWLDGWRYRLLESLRPPNFDPKCGFCGKSDREVAKLIAGPSVMICNECIQLCSEILGES